MVPRVGDPERAPATIARPMALKVPEVAAELRSAEESDGDVMAKLSQGGEDVVQQRFALVPLARWLTADNLDLGWESLTRDLYPGLSWSLGLGTCPPTPC